MKNSYLLFLLITFIIFSCDDSNISKTDLLIKSWMLDAVTLEGEAYYQEAIYSKNSIYTFFDDETVQIVIPQSQDIIKATWQLKDNVTELHIAFSGVMNVYKIEKINNSNLWLLHENSKGNIIYKYSKMILE